MKEFRTLTINTIFAFVLSSFASVKKKSEINSRVFISIENAWWDKFRQIELQLLSLFQLSIASGV